MPRETNDHKGSNQDPEETFRGLQHIAEAKEYHILSWSPGPPGTDHPSTQVHIIYPITEAEFAFAIRMKSRRAIQEMIDVLTDHMENVWPRPQKGKKKK